MDETTPVVTTPTVGGDGGQTPPAQVSTPSSQEPAKIQEPPQVQVENPVVETPSQSLTRRQPSEWSRERMRFRKLENSVTDIQKTLNSFQSLIEKLNAANGKSSEPKKLDLNDDTVYSDVPGVLRNLRSEVVDAIQNLKKEILEKDIPKQFESFNRESEIRKRDVEATQKVVKSGINPRDLADFIAEDDWLANSYSIDPLRTVDVAINEYKKAFPEVTLPKNPNAPKKSNMISLGGGGNPNPSGSKDIENVRTQIKELTTMFEKNNALISDPKFKEKFETLKKELASLAPAA